VELTLIVPVILLILMIGLDFGRVYLGWVSLNNTARIAANYAASNAALMSSGNAGAIATYSDLIRGDALTTNCTPVIAPPTYPGGTGLGNDAEVHISCQFSLFTPIISNVIGSPITVSASSVFPIRTGIISGTGGGAPAVLASFTVSPSTGPAPLAVTFTDTSTGSPSTWSWDFDADGTPDSTSSGTQAFTYGTPGTYHPRLTVSNGLSISSATMTVTVTVPPGPIANFTATPMTGSANLVVSFDNLSTGTNPLTYLWNFGDGTTSTAKNPPTKSYPAGSWTVTLTVTDKDGLTSTAPKTIVVGPAIPQCTVPTFKGKTSNQNQADWTAAGFNTTIIFNPARPPEYTIAKQSLKAGTKQNCSGTVITISSR